MITKTLNLDDAYQELFDEVREKSNGAINVDNLEAFFGSIEEIAAVDSKFLRLPLDEPLFEIDANSRKINVPAEFKSNGVSVQGDHLAEIIFFRIARFFDYKDLSTCDIKINWKMGAKEGKTTRFIKFDSVMVEPEETKTECVIFGWPINDVVTEKSGTLTFAIEFSQLNEETGKNKYVFNTLPITVSIKDGLILSETAEAFTLDDDIINNLVNSSFGEGSAAVGDIVWLTGDGHGLVTGAALGGPGGTIISFNPDDWRETINLETNISNGEPSSVGINLIAQAFVDNGTVIRYTDKNGQSLDEAMVKVSEVLIPVEDRANPDKKYYAGSRLDPREPTEEDLADESVELFEIAPLNENLIYYTQVEDSEPAAYVKASDENIAKWGSKTMVDLYSKIASIFVDQAGSYAIRAQGEKYDNNDIKIGAGEVTSTSIVTVPAVQAPSEVVIEVPELILPVPEENATGFYSFSEDVSNTIFLNGTDTISVTATAAIDSFGALQFTWEKKLDGDADFSNVAEGNVDFQAINSSNLEISAVGQYKVSAVNFLNGASSDPVESAVLTASPLAGKIEMATAKYQIGSRQFAPVTDTISYNSAGSLSSNNVTLKIDNIVMAQNGQVGTYEYEWYKEVLNAELESSWELIEGATNAELHITSGEGKFLPKVKNNLNGSVYTFTLPSVSVDDIAN